MVRYLSLDETVSETIRILAENCRRRRAALGLSQAELAERTGIAVSHTSNIENARANPTVEILDLLAGEFGCRTAALLMPMDDEPSG
ncbi:transcriptional regulator with XRE-family HTH domain [Sphingobium wenxiniae]|jgi:transcriptional regulator with XRE-family HTH domain|uniref:Helix-turn-helix protein n=1 Tax=Sphingobium wenxiniae (strain DSM 21828 / CGMCC 1.7748 / JZ-1) TaxID=595605 RepID=A0A562K818_SPHWJ|nr:helix-turn-helix transcriptional regulator [Sphingobium wenxiniae]MBB6193133.1 transcriptional regulator with XRE-family HTH domain [Sphingobium wenxiniae]MBE5075032.1 helix-turn-helix transcriptional regulator [Erythrobacteraceae bacterium E2-1 Yellow Sea]TWH91579.1 helix-turn-helix protein [Sphingobium wenxiniae]